MNPRTVYKYFARSAESRRFQKGCLFAASMHLDDWNGNYGSPLIFASMPLRCVETARLWLLPASIYFSPWWCDDDVPRVADWPM